MANTWKFRISNTGANIEALSRTLGSRQDFSITREEPDDGHVFYWLSSRWLDGIVELQELSNRLSAVRCLVDGAIFLYKPPPIQFDCIWDQKGPVESPLANAMFDHLILNEAIDGETGMRSTLPTPVLMDGLQVLLDGAPRLVPEAKMSFAADPIGTALFLARHDYATRGCLVCLGYSGVTFVSLYQCRDFMKREGIDAAILAAKKTEVDIKRFDHTANNFEASGPAGRHGEKGQKAPASPMSEAEARAVLLPVIRHFLLERGKALGIVPHSDTLPW